MTDATLLFLPTGDAGFRWLRIADAGLSEGDGLPAAGEDVLAVVPADAVTLHWAELPSRSTAQAATAARILASEASAAPIGELHVAVGREDGLSERPIGVVAAADMRGWLVALAEAGVEPRAMLPAPMLLPRPEEGYARAEIAGHGLVRGTTSGFADEERLTALVTGGVAPTTLDRDAVTAAIRAVFDAPTLDLRQGPFARRRGFAIDWGLVRRLALLALTILAVTLAISLVRIVKLNLAADALEQRAEMLARQGLPRGEAVNDADRQLDERLARVRGPGQGFTATAAAVFTAVRGVPGAEVTALNFADNGDLRLSLTTEGEGQVTDLKGRIESAGFMVRAGVFQSAAGRVSGEFTVSPK